MSNQNIKNSTNFVEVNGFGTVRLKDRSTRDVFVYGYFTFYHWTFMVHQDVLYPQYVAVSEASTGCSLKDEIYYTVEDALYYAIAFCESKRYYFSTEINNILVKVRHSIGRSNGTGTRTLALDMTLWT